MTHKHYRNKVIDGILNVTDNPQNWRLKEWIGNPDVSPLRLIKDMEREGLLEIKFENDNGKVRRKLKVLQ